MTRRAMSLLLRPMATTIQDAGHIDRDRANVLGRVYRRGRGARITGVVATVNWAAAGWVAVALGLGCGPELGGIGGDHRDELQSGVSYGDIILGCDRHVAGAVGANGDGETVVLDYGLRLPPGRPGTITISLRSGERGDANGGEANAGQGAAITVSERHPGGHTVAIVPDESRQETDAADSAVERLVRVVTPTMGRQSLRVDLRGRGTYAVAITCGESAAETMAINIDPKNLGGNPGGGALRAAGARWARIEWKICPATVPEVASELFAEPVDYCRAMLESESLLAAALETYRDAIRRLHDDGIKVLLIVDYSTLPDPPPWRSPSCLIACDWKRARAMEAWEESWTPYIESFARRVERLAEDYGDLVDAWQVWNEPDLFDEGGTYSPYVPPRQYVAMLDQVAAVIRRHSSRPVITGGFASGTPAYQDGYMNTVAHAALGFDQATDQPVRIAGVLPVDGIAVHPYGRQTGLEPVSWGTGGRLDDLFDYYLAFGLPLWVSEVGMPGDAAIASDDPQPLVELYLPNVYDVAQHGYPGRVRHVFWFCWSDAMVPPFGLRNGDDTPKGVFAQFRQVAPPWNDATEGPVFVAD